MADASRIEISFGPFKLNYFREDYLHYILDQPILITSPYF
jgi:hypothetical protein